MGNLREYLDGPIGDVFVDDRAEVLDKQVEADYVALLGLPPDWQATLDRYDIDVVVWQRDSPARGRAEGVARLADPLHRSAVDRGDSTHRSVMWRRALPWVAVGLVAVVGLGVAGWIVSNQDESDPSTVHLTFDCISASRGRAPGRIRHGTSSLRRRVHEADPRDMRQAWESSRYA